MATAQDIKPGDTGNNNPPLSPEFANSSSENSHILKNSGWLCGFQVDNLDKPRVSPRRVASYVDGVAPSIEETNDVLTEVITTRNKRESNYVHHGWSVGAIPAISPWTVSRIHAANRHNAGGTWVTRRTLVTRLRAQVLLRDLAPVPEFVAAIEAALELPTRFERFQAVYDALSRWGDVLPLEMEIGFSLTLTDTETNFAQLPAIPFHSLAHVSTIKTADIIRKGAMGSTGWDDGTWTKLDVPTAEWRPITIVKVVPTINLLDDVLQSRLDELYAEKLSYNPCFSTDPPASMNKAYNDMDKATRTISRVAVWVGGSFYGLSVTRLDGVVSVAGGKGGTEHSFELAKGEHIVEMLTCANGTQFFGMQFITNTGRCSPMYGRFEGVPSVARSKGGILAGFSIRTVLDRGTESVTGVLGIWRHDLKLRIPKENGVYSDYFGRNSPYGVNFNDRSLIGNSSSMYISSVEVRSGAEIDSIQFTYKDSKKGPKDKTKSALHGGPNGGHHEFVLREGEHIVAVSGKYSQNSLTQLCFETSIGRTSEVYGTGSGQSFTAQAPPGDNGKPMRLQYTLGKSDGSKMCGIMFVWAPWAP